MIARFILIAFVLCGCASAPPQRSADQLRAEQVARLFAVESLGLSEPQLARMKADVGLGDGREMTIQFYDPKVIHPDKNGSIWAMDGGFPSYLRITVDTETWKVVRRYASPE